MKVVQSNGRCYKSIRLWKIVVVRMNNKITIFVFHQCHFEGHPPLSTLVIHISSFDVIEIVGFDPSEARQGDIAIEVALS
jgi:hypothetical protein